MEYLKIKQPKKVIFTKQFFIDLAKEYSLNAAMFERLGNGRSTEIIVNDELLKILIELQDQFAKLKEMDNDEYRAFYIELPRPTSEEWGNCEVLIAEGEYEDKEEFHKEWEFSNPRETVWYHVESAKYRENRIIRFTDRKYSYFTIANFSGYGDRKGDYSDSEWYKDFLVMLTLYLHKLIEAITQDSDGFNEYVTNRLPYQQRDERIARKKFNRIKSGFKIRVKDEEIAIKTLRNSVCKKNGVPLDAMTIRLYCKYYRIAHEAYELYFQKSDNARKERTIPDKLQDVAYYNMVKFKKIDSEYDLDCEADFRKFASDHCGELGLSRLNVVASDLDRPGWRIIVSNSYSAYVDVAIEVATALYKVGAPLEICDAEKFLKILKEEDYVKLIPDTFHDYISYHEEGTVYQLPWEYECLDDRKNYLTLEQYNEIISLAEWEEIKKVKIR